VLVVRQNQPGQRLGWPFIAIIEIPCSSGSPQLGLPEIKFSYSVTGSKTPIPAYAKPAPYLIRGMPGINSGYYEHGARISSDKKYMFFTRSTGCNLGPVCDTGDIYWVELKEYLAEAKTW